MLLEEGFEAFGGDMLRTMTAFCRNPHAAEDAVQHAFMQGCAHRALLQQMPDKAMRAWLYTAARNYLIDQARKSRRLVYGLAEDTPTDGPDPVETILAQALIEDLPPPLAEVVRMKYYGGLNATQIGRALDLPPATVRTRLKKAMGTMNKKMKEDG